LQSRDELFSLEKGCKANINLKLFSNWLIHSYIFTLEFTEEGIVSGFLFTSDEEKDGYIYKIGLEKFVNILKLVGHSGVIQSRVKRNSEEKIGFSIERQYGFDDCIPRKGLQKTKINLLCDLLPKDDK
jgi:hypothetical protein